MRRLPFASLLPLVAGFARPEDDYYAHRPATKDSYMNCGSTSLCGVLALESGLGTAGGYYKHAVPGVHGLWPEIGEYGSSACKAPADSSDPKQPVGCYEDGSGASHILEFMTHEWEKHGKCAGVHDSTDFFTQICDLSKAPVALMVQTRASGKTDIADYGSALTAAGYPVFAATDSEHGQVELSACADDSGKWHLAAVKDFASVCGSGPTPSPSPSPSPSPTPTPSGQCVKDEKGPPCTSDGQCTKLKNCIRCSHHGFCTDVPLSD